MYYLLLDNYGEINQIKELTNREYVLFHKGHLRILYVSVFEDRENFFMLVGGLCKEADESITISVSTRVGGW